MRINSISQNYYLRQNSYCPHFCSKKLLDVNLRNRAQKALEPAQVVELDYSKSDEELINSMHTSWSSTRYFPSISAEYAISTGNYKFHMVAAGNRNIIKRKDVKSIVDFEILGRQDNKILCINYLQSAPEIANNRNSDIEGAGELLMYSVVKYAKESKCKKITLVSSCNGFYRNIGLKATQVINDKAARFELEEKDYDEFLARVEKKYGFKTL